ncbi:MAG: replicative DNA helicase [Nitrospirae bacterium]|nr:replicative DNA helicase [Nitrospirota bacterium]
MDTIDVALQKLPPQNIEAEQSVLGAILMDNAALNKAIEIVDVDDFYKDTHRRIYTAMLDLYEKGDAIDLITLTDHLQKKGELELIGGSSYLAVLVNIVPTAANIKYHSKLVHEKAMLRNLINTATEIVTTSYENSHDVEELLDYAEKNIFAISEKRIKPSFVNVKDIVRSSFETIERLYEKKEMVTGLATGFLDFDVMTSGFQPGDLIIVAGRPGMGKTAFAMCVTQYVGIEKQTPAAVFSLEMTKEQLVLRMLCSEARVDAHKLRSGYLGKTDWPKLTTAAGRLSEAPIFIDDSSALSVIEMRAKARRLKAEHGLGLIIVDYMQLMKGRGRADTREQEISEISRSLKALAKELSIPVIAKAQCTCGRRGMAEAIIGKQRNGPTGTVKLAYIDKYTRFENKPSAPAAGAAWQRQ